MSAEKIQAFTSGTIVAGAQGTATNSGSPSTVVQSMLYAVSGQALIPVLCNSFGEVGRFIKKYTFPRYVVSGDSLAMYTSSPINGDIIGIRATIGAAGSLSLAISGTSAGNNMNNIELYKRKIGSATQSIQEYYVGTPYTENAISTGSIGVSHAVNDVMSIGYSGTTISGTGKTNGPITLLYR